MAKKIKTYIQNNTKTIFLVSLALNLLLLLILITGQNSGSVKVAGLSHTDNVVNNQVEVSKGLYIEVLGQVHSPGVYYLKDPIMVIEALDLAGGVTASADMEYVHKNMSLSKVVVNNEKIYVPSKTTISANSSVTGTNSDGKVNINTSSQNDLEELPYIGEVLAKRIIEGRPFIAVEDLKQIEGITDSIYNKLVTLIVI